MFYSLKNFRVLSNMFEIEKLLGELSETSVVIDVDIDDNFDFNQKDVAFLIESGSLLAYAGRKSVKGVRATQTFGPYDPIGFAEVIAGRARTVEYRKLSALRLRKFQANYLRTKVNASNIFSQTIIKYSLGRIFETKKSGGNVLLEEEFINENHSLLRDFKVAEGEMIFEVENSADAMYFIEKGSVGIFSANNKRIAGLNSGDCFGEAALISDRTRNYSAIAERETQLLLIERNIVKRELERVHAIVRLSVMVLLKRLELMNKMKLVGQKN